jgi:type I restriction enzyme, S subunit
MKRKFWQGIRLGDCLTIKHGYAFKGEHFGNKGTHIVLTPGNFFDEGGFKHKGDKEKWYSGSIPKEYILSQGDILIAMTEQAEGLLGSAAIVPKNDRYLHNQRLGLIQSFNGFEKRFLYYLFNSQPVRQQIRASCSGVKVRHTSPSRIYEIKVEVPPLSIQRKIAAVLSAYDDLIENNLRRIKILEEMAQNLYREWFVNFRYPGWENGRVVDSPLGQIPEGWEAVRLNDVCHLTMGQSPKSEFYNREGVGLPFHQGVTNFGDRFPTEQLYCTVNGRIAEQGDILFSVRAPVGRINIANTRMIIGRGLSAIRHKAGCQWFTFHLLKENFKEEDTMGGGTIFKSVTKSDMEGITFTLPINAIVQQFEETVEPWNKQIENLTRKNVTLRETRDLLLPKLISGELDVSELDITIPQEDKEL